MRSNVSANLFMRILRFTLLKANCVDHPIPPWSNTVRHKPLRGVGLVCESIKRLAGRKGK